MKFFLEHSLDEKRRWMRVFFRSYSQEVRYDEFSPELYGPNVRFLVIRSTAGQRQGFLRLNNKSTQFPNHTASAVWNITDGYVKPPYRSKGVLKELIAHSVAELNVEMMCLHPAVYEKHRFYYEELGFLHHIRGARSGLIWLFQDRFWPIVAQSR